MLSSERVKKKRIHQNNAHAARLYSKNIIKKIHKSECMAFRIDIEKMKAGSVMFYIEKTKDEKGLQKNRAFSALVCKLNRKAQFQF